MRWLERIILLDEKPNAAARTRLVPLPDSAPAASFTAREQPDAVTVPAGGVVGHGQQRVGSIDGAEREPARLPQAADLP